MYRNLIFIIEILKTLNPFYPYFYINLSYSTSYCIANIFIFIDKMLHNTTNIYQYAYLLMFIKKNASLYLIFQCNDYKSCFLF